jgi:thiamine kinase-like enzyme
LIVKIGEKIGEGGCSEVFELDNVNKIIKLAKSNTDIEAIRREYNNSRIAWESGLSVPEAFELVDINGRPGIVFERIYGETLMERFVKHVLKRPSSEEDLTELEEHNDIRITARILSEIHNKSNLNMPSQREGIKHSIRGVDYLSPTEKEAVLAILDSLLIKQQLCHGDPNPGNILIRDEKAVIIDWMNASLGNPEGDLAEYIIMIRYAILPSHLPNEVVSYFNSIRESIIKVFIDEYTRLSDITYDEIDAWITPIAARKLSDDGISEDEKILLVNEIRKRLKDQGSGDISKHCN